MTTQKHIESDRISPLSTWIDRKYPIPERFYRRNYTDVPSSDWSVWLTLEEVTFLYNVKSMKWLGLINSRNLIKDYLKKASKLINGLNGGWLDSEEREIILDNLGEPPLPCLPIYIITCDDGNEEKVVYVGKTKNESRFNGGHYAAIKLLNPEFEGLKKRIYRCSIWFYFKDEYIVLDWIQPGEVALQILDSIESQLIYHFQPQLNTNKKKQDKSIWNFTLHIQNFLGNRFLNDTFL